MKAKRQTEAVSNSATMLDGNRGQVIRISDLNSLRYSPIDRKRRFLTLGLFHLLDFKASASRVCWSDLISKLLDNRFTTGSTVHRSAGGICRLKPMFSCSIYTPLSRCSYLVTL